MEWLSTLRALMMISMRTKIEVESEVELRRWAMAMSKAKLSLIRDACAALGESQTRIQDDLGRHN